MTSQRLVRVICKVRPHATHGVVGGVVLVVEVVDSRHKPGAPGAVGPLDAVGDNVPSVLVLLSEDRAVDLKGQPLSPTIVARRGAVKHEAGVLGRDAVRDTVSRWTSARRCRHRSHRRAHNDRWLRRRRYHVNRRPCGSGILTLRRCRSRKHQEHRGHLGVDRLHGGPS